MLDIYLLRISIFFHSYSSLGTRSNIFIEAIKVGLLCNLLVLHKLHVSPNFSSFLPRRPFLTVLRSTYNKSVNFIRS